MNTKVKFPCTVDTHTQPTPARIIVASPDLLEIFICRFPRQLEAVTRMMRAPNERGEDARGEKDNS